MMFGKCKTCNVQQSHIDRLVSENRDLKDAIESQRVKHYEEVKELVDRLMSISNPASFALLSRQHQRTGARGTQQDETGKPRKIEVFHPGYNPVIPQPRPVVVTEAKNV